MPGDAAVSVMTDFQRIIPATTLELTAIDDALRKMIRAGVRSLLVVRGDLVVGLVTSYDIQGEKPILSQQGGALDDHGRHDEVRVSHVMTGLESVPQASYSALLERRVGDVIETFAQHPDWLHLLVVDEFAFGGVGLRGIVSRTEIDRRVRNWTV